MFDRYYYYYYNDIIISILIWKYIMSRKFENVFYLNSFCLSYLCTTGAEKMYFNNSFDLIFVERFYLSNGNNL